VVAACRLAWAARRSASARRSLAVAVVLVMAIPVCW
jgi:hypothetical protein